MRVFVDTNVVISALLFPNGKVAKVFSHLLEKHTVIISSYTKEECKEVFEKKFPAKINRIFIENCGKINLWHRIQNISIQNSK